MNGEIENTCKCCVLIETPIVLYIINENHEKSSSRDSRQPPTLFNPKAQLM